MQYDFLIVCCFWHWHKWYVMLMKFSMVPFHFLGHDDWNERQHDFSGHLMPLARCWHNIMVSALSKEPLHSLHQDNWNGEQHELFCSWHNCHQHLHHMMPLASVSHDAYSITYTMIIFSSRWYWLWYYMMPLGSVSYNANSIISGTIVFHM